MVNLLQTSFVISVIFGITSAWSILGRDEDEICSRRSRQTFVGLLKCLSSVNEEAQKLRSPLISGSTRLNVFIDVVYDAPPTTYQVCCETHNSRGRNVDLNPLKTDMRTNALDTRLLPMIEFQKANGLGSGEQLFTLLLVKKSYDDRYLGAPHKPFILWMVTNIPRDKVSSGDVIVPYMGPACVEDSTRYMFLLYRQSGPTIVDYTSYSDPTSCPEMSSNAFRCQFDARRFALENKLKIVGANWFDCSYSTYSIYKMIHDLNITEVDACLMDEAAHVTVQNGKMICPNSTEAGHMTSLGATVNDALRSRDHNQTDVSSTSSSPWSFLDYFTHLFSSPMADNTTLPLENKDGLSYSTGADFYEPDPQLITDSNTTDMQYMSPFFKYDTPEIIKDTLNESVQVVNDSPLYADTVNAFEIDMANDTIPSIGDLNSNNINDIAPPQDEVIAKGGSEINLASDISPPKADIVAVGGQGIGPIGYEEPVVTDGSLQNSILPDITPPKGEVIAQGGVENTKPNVKLPPFKATDDLDNTFFPGGKFDDYFDTAVRKMADIDEAKDKMKGDDGRGIYAYKDGRIVKTGGFEDGLPGGLLDLNPSYNSNSQEDNTNILPPVGQTVATGEVSDALPGGMLDLNPPFDITSQDDDRKGIPPIGEIVATGGASDTPSGVLDLNQPAYLQSPVGDKSSFSVKSLMDGFGEVSPSDTADENNLSVKEPFTENEAKLGNVIATGGLVVPPDMPGRGDSFPREQLTTMPSQIAVDPIPYTEPIPEFPVQDLRQQDVMSNKEISIPEFQPEKPVQDGLRQIFDRIFESKLNSVGNFEDNLMRMKRSVEPPPIDGIHVFSSPRINRLKDLIRAISSSFQDDDQEIIPPEEPSEEIPSLSPFSQMLSRGIPQGPPSIFDIIESNSESNNKPVPGMPSVFGPISDPIREMVSGPSQNPLAGGRIMIRLFGPKAFLLHDMDPSMAVNPFNGSPFAGQLMSSRNREDHQIEDEIPATRQYPTFHSRMGPSPTLLSILARKRPGHPFLKMFGRIPFQKPSPQPSFFEPHENPDTRSDSMASSIDYDLNKVAPPPSESVTTHSSTLNSMMADLPRNDNDLITKAAPSIDDGSIDTTSAGNRNDDTLRFYGNDEKPSMSHNMEQNQLYAR